MVRIHQGACDLCKTEKKLLKILQKKTAKTLGDTFGLKVNKYSKPLFLTYSSL